MKAGDLPEGWAGSNLEEILQGGLFSDGDWIESKDQDPSGEVRLIQLADVGEGEFRNRSSRFLTTETAERLGCTILRPGDVLVARMPDPLGRACQFPGDPKPSITAVDVCIARPASNGPDPRWLMHAINAPQFRGQMEEFERGTTRKRISRKNLGVLSISVPPLAEQKRIVEKVEALLARVQAARDRLERVQQILRRFRQAVLAAAFEAAKLGPTNETRLGELTTKIGSGATPRGGSEIYVPKGVPFIRSMNVRFEGFTEEGLAFLTKAHAKELENVRTKPGDVLINITGASIGRTCLLPQLLVDARVSQHVAILRPVRQQLLSEFLQLYLSSPQIQSRINSEEYGVTRQALTKGWLTELEIPLPALDVQSQTVSTVASLLRVADSLARRVEQGQRRSDRLPVAILAKAFTGELVPAEVELARAEGRAYESGEELLARVRGRGGGAPAASHRPKSTRGRAPASGRRARR